MDLVAQLELLSMTYKKNEKGGKLMSKFNDEVSMDVLKIVRPWTDELLKESR